MIFSLRSYHFRRLRVFLEWLGRSRTAFSKGFQVVDHCVSGDLAVRLRWWIPCDGRSIGTLR